MGRMVMASLIPAAVQRTRVERSGTRVKAPRFSYVVAQSVAHAVQLLHEYGDGARILAGGQSLMPALNMRLSQPKLLIETGSTRLGALRGCVRWV